MAGINDRKDAFENKYAHDQEVQFKVNARTSKMMGLWAAEQMGLKGGEADAYAKQIVMVDLEEAGFGDVKRRIMMTAIFISSDGWSWKKPILIQRCAPMRNLGAKIVKSPFDACGGAAVES